MVVRERLLGEEKRKVKGNNLLLKDDFPHVPHSRVFMLSIRVFLNGVHLLSDSLPADGLCVLPSALFFPVLHLHLSDLLFCFRDYSL